MKNGNRAISYVMQICIYIAGLLFLAFGVAFSVNSNLGVSPVNTLPYVISKIVGIDMGSCVIAVFSVYILIQILLLRKKIRWINLTQILFSTVFGCFVDIAKWAVGDFSLPTYAGQLLMLAISIVLVAVGVCLYLDVKLVHMPMEGMTHAVNETLWPGLPFHEVKVIMDCVAVGTGMVLSLLVHFGAAASQMEKRGIHTERGNLNREIEVTNQLLRQLKARIGKLQNWLKEAKESPAPPLPTTFKASYPARHRQKNRAFPSPSIT